MLIFFNFDSKIFKRKAKGNTRGERSVKGARGVKGVSGARSVKGVKGGEGNVVKDLRPPPQHDYKKQQDIKYLSELFRTHLDFFKNPQEWNSRYYILDKKNIYFQHNDTKLFWQILTNHNTGSLIIKFYYLDNNKYIQCPFHFTIYFMNPVNWPHVTTEYDNTFKVWCENTPPAPQPPSRSSQYSTSRYHPYPRNSSSSQGNSSKYPPTAGNIRMYIEVESLDDLIDMFNKNVNTLFVTVSLPSDCKYKVLLNRAYILASEAMVDILTEFKYYIYYVYQSQNGGRKSINKPIKTVKKSVRAPKTPKTPKAPVKPKVTKTRKVNVRFK
jgi:hypothetical protein